MSALRIPLRVVFYKDDGDWIAHCLEFDLLGDGTTQVEALECLNEAIRLQIESSLEHENLENLFCPADAKYHRMFAAGHDVAFGDWKMTDREVEIQEVRQREYVDRAPAMN